MVYVNLSLLTWLRPEEPSKACQQLNLHRPQDFCIGETFPVVARDLYRVDGVISGEFEPVGPAPYEHQMICFSMVNWQTAVTAGVSECP